MSWFSSSSEWKQNLSMAALNKVEELENKVDKLVKEKSQKQNQLDTLHQQLEKQKRKADDEVKERQTLLKENEQLARSCEELQFQLQKGQHDHVTSNVGILPPQRQMQTQEQIGVQTEELEYLRRKIAELEQEKTAVITNLNETKVSVSKTNAAGNESDSFWGGFGESSHHSFPRPAIKTPVKKALETSEENPFKVPSTSKTPHKMGMHLALVIIWAMTLVSALHESVFPKLLPGAIIDHNGRVAMASDYISILVNLSSVTSLPQDLRIIQKNMWNLNKDLDIILHRLDDPDETLQEEMVTIKHLRVLIANIKRTINMSVEKLIIAFSWFPTEESNRRKRGLFDFVGSGLHYLFGTARSQDISFLQNKIITLQQARNKHERIIEHLNTNLHTQLEKINELITVTNQFEKSRIIRAKVTDILIILTYVSHISLHLANDINLALEHVKDTIDAVSLATSGIVTTELLTNTELTNILHDATDSYNLQPLFPYEQIYKYYTYLDVQIAPSHLIIHVPMSTNYFFQRYSITPFPTYYQGKTIVMDINNTNMLVSEDLEHYLQLSDTELNKCEVGEFTICNSGISPWRKFTNVNTCQALMIQNDFVRENMNKVCTFKQVPDEFTLKLVKSYSFVYNPKSLKLRLTCDKVTNLTSAKRLMFHSSCDLNSVNFQVTGSRTHEIDLTKNWKLVEEEIDIINETLHIEAKLIKPLNKSTDTLSFLDSSSTNLIVSGISISSFAMIILAGLTCIIFKCRNRIRSCSKQKNNSDRDKMSKTIHQPAAQTQHMTAPTDDASATNF